MKTTRLKENHCPTCSHILDAASSGHGHVPEVGDLTICIYCAEFLFFDENMKMVKLSDDEFINLSIINRLHLLDLREKILSKLITAEEK